MKLGKLTFKIVAISMLFISNSMAGDPAMSEEEIGLRHTNLYSEDKVVGDKTQYGKKAAGESTKFERAFENAPPMIPHDVEGLLPITIDNNACLGCHEPAVAAEVKATPIPKSHFTNFRPDTVLNKKGKIVKEGIVVENTSDFKTVAKAKDVLVGARFNCSQCHTPQSVGNDVPQNDFFAEFRNKDSKGKSNLIDVMNEGVK